MGVKCIHSGSRAVVCLLLASCGGLGPQPPKPGTPEFFRQAAEASFNEGDLEAVHRNLDQLTLSDNPHRGDATIWLIVLSAGMARGAMEWADLLDQGRETARMEQVEFERLSMAARRTADLHAMHLAELVQAHHAGPPMTGIRLVFAFPAVDANPPAGAQQVSKGLAPKPAEAEALGALMQRRGLALTLRRLANAGADTAKARAFLDGKAVLPPAAFEWYLAQEFDALSRLYEPARLHHVARARLLLGEAAAALAASGDTPEARALAKAVEEKRRQLPN